MVNVKPPLVEVAPLNVGVARTFCAEPDTVPVAELTKPALVAVTETVAEAPLLNPLTVTVEPDLLTEPAVVESVYPLAAS
jgi:hypothetical protein